MNSIEKDSTGTRRLAAVILYETSSPSPDYKPLYEEDIVLIEAISKEDAENRAITHAQEQKGSYQNEDGETITNTFKSLIDVQLMEPELGHGSSLYTRYFHSYEAYARFEPLLQGQPL